MNTHKKRELVIDKIRRHFEVAAWEHKFQWGDGKYYGDKYETVKSLAKKIDCPYTSLYIPIKQLVAAGFITFNDGLVMYEREIEPPAESQGTLWKELITRIDNGADADTLKQDYIIQKINKNG